jgi:hypothetical protein
MIRNVLSDSDPDPTLEVWDQDPALDPELDFNLNKNHQKNSILLNKIKHKNYIFLEKHYLI